MRTSLSLILLTAVLCGCHPLRIPPGVVQGTIDTEVKRAAQGNAASPPPAAVTQALLPPLSVEMPTTSKLLEQRFDLAVSNAPANQVTDRSAPPPRIAHCHGEGPPETLTSRRFRQVGTCPRRSSGRRTVHERISSPRSSASSRA